MNKLPLISVAMSALNEEAHIQEAVESILNQSFKDFEFIVLDNGSTDGTSEILHKLASYDSRLKIITNKNTQTLSEAFNTLLNHCQGKYIARMDADDYSHPTRLEKQIIYLESHPDIGVLGTHYVELDDKGNSVPRPQSGTDWPILKEQLLRYNPFCHPSMMIRRELFNKYGSYIPQYRVSQDYDLFCRFAQYTKCENLGEVLVTRRFPDDALNSSKMRRQDVETFLIRWNMLRRGQLPVSYIYYLIKPLMAWFLPIRLRETARRWRQKNKKLAD